jgi:hypothetical protein
VRAQPVGFNASLVSSQEIKWIRYIQHLGQLGVELLPPIWDLAAEIGSANRGFGRDPEIGPPEIGPLFQRLLQVGNRG